MEIVLIALTIYFLTNTGHWFEFTLKPALSWNTAFAIFTLGFVLWIIHDFYWIHKSISYMIERRAKHISELDIEETGQVGDGDAEEVI